MSRYAYEDLTLDEIKLFDLSDFEDLGDELGFYECDALAWDYLNDDVYDMFEKETEEALKASNLRQLVELRDEVYDLCRKPDYSLLRERQNEASECFDLTFDDYFNNEDVVDYLESLRDGDYSEEYEVLRINAYQRFVEDYVDHVESIYDELYEKIDNAIDDIEESKINIYKSDGDKYVVEWVDLDNDNMSRKFKNLSVAKKFAQALSDYWYYDVEIYDNYTGELLEEY